MLQFCRLLQRFRRDDSGVFAVVFGIMAVVLVAMGGAVVDYVTLEQARTRSQTALDAATLALQPSINDPAETDETIREKAEALVLERLGTQGIHEAKIDTVVVNRDKGELMLSGSFAVETIFVKLVGVDLLYATITSQATKGIANVEVSIALDVTGSMSITLPSGATRLKTLKDATHSLVDTILALNRTGNYAKVALVPYAQSVNVAPYEEAIRGPIRPRRDIQTISWTATGYQAITNISTANPAVFTSSRHGLRVNDYVYVRDTGVSKFDTQRLRVSSVSTDTFTLDISGGINSVVANKGSFAKCRRSDCMAVFTSPGHGYAEGEEIWVQDVAGLTSYNNRKHIISAVTANSFVITGTAPNRNQTHQANTGRFWCRWQTESVGCVEFEFTDIGYTRRVQQISTCATERARNAATDTPPSTTFMGRNYPYIDPDPDYSNVCSSSKIVPLTTSKATLTSAINGLTAGGSTSGSTGILWSWNMLAPSFGYVWPTSAPAPYHQRHLMKAAIIMTDGEFNTVHCNGVVSGISSTGGSGNAERINCASPNGGPYKQASDYCTAMKNNTGIQVYTVGFGITKGSPAAIALENCASSLANHFLADNAASLNDAFDQIARQITALRLTR
ncbi:hypothetical protein JHL21_08815 [Devosia sp. WQ 349]|uniref:TadE/TadG family type IV pilus assembly protein n=1 Tax=Devosia sp. WQ 349K1 TaxID=2800329 RepID=UPI0019075349|nr:pilus assembly protein [Devosia sp. WQ 349K1]MBK1794606.1 hypothetical protein [Devosia sp. WQ 349K1]